MHRHRLLSPPPITPSHPHTVRLLPPLPIIPSHPHTVRLLPPFPHCYVCLSLRACVCLCRPLAWPRLDPSTGSWLSQRESMETAQPVQEESARPVLASPPVQHGIDSPISIVPQRAISNNSFSQRMLATSPEPAASEAYTAGVATSDDAEREALIRAILTATQVCRCRCLFHVRVHECMHMIACSAHAFVPRGANSCERSSVYQILCLRHAPCRLCHDNPMFPIICAFRSIKWSPSAIPRTVCCYLCCFAGCITVGLLPLLLLLV